MKRKVVLGDEVKERVVITSALRSKEYYDVGISPYVSARKLGGSAQDSYPSIFSAVVIVVVGKFKQKGSETALLTIKPGYDFAGCFF
eukprot:6211106-Pleurochrysis_carterae.AAC.1